MPEWLPTLLSQTVVALLGGGGMAGLVAWFRARHEMPVARESASVANANSVSAQALALVSSLELRVKSLEEKLSAAELAARAALVSADDAQRERADLRRHIEAVHDWIDAGANPPPPPRPDLAREDV